MVSDDFFEFIELLDKYTPDITEADFNAIYSFEAFDDWANHIRMVHNKFRRSIFTNCVDNPNFKAHLVKIAFTLQSYIREHSTIKYPTFLDKADGSYDSYKGRFFYDKFYNKLLSEVKSAYNCVKTNMCDEKEMTDVYWMGTRHPYTSKPFVCDINAVYDFLNSIYSLKDGKVIESLSKGELTLDSYSDMLSDLCTKYVNEIHYVKSLDELPFDFSYLVEQFKWYNDFDFTKNEIKESRDYWELEYHKIRYRELSRAIKSTEERLTKVQNRTLKGNNKKITPNNLDASYSKQQLDNIHNETIIPHEKTFKENYDDDKLQHIYDYIIKVGYLDVDTPFENFKYCMTGKGTPTSGLVWKGGINILAYFIHSICNLSKHQWVKGTAVFGTKVANANMNNSQKENPFKELKSELKNM